jgi:hypothetical protein
MENQEPQSEEHVPSKLGVAIPLLLVALLVLTVALNAC